MIGDSDKLWLMYVNEQVNKLVVKNETLEGIAQEHSRILNFVKEEVAPKRIQLFEQSTSETKLETQMRY